MLEEPAPPADSVLGVLVALLPLLEGSSSLLVFLQGALGGPVLTDLLAQDVPFDYFLELKENKVIIVTILMIHQPSRL